LKLEGIVVVMGSGEIHVFDTRDEMLQFTEDLKNNGDPLWILITPADDFGSEYVKMVDFIYDDEERSEEWEGIS